MKKIFEKPGVEMICIVSEPITDDFVDTEGGYASGNTPEN